MEKIIVCMVCLGIMCTACQSMNSDLREETARVIGTYSPGDITVSDVERGATVTTWRAETPKSTYKCSADNTLRRVKCRN
jgi:hypothetical protein